MADCYRVHTTRGCLHYQPRSSWHEPSRPTPTLFHHRFSRPSRICVAQVAADCLACHPKATPKSQLLRKLAGPRDNALRFFRSVIAAHSVSPKSDPVQTDPLQRRSSEALHQEEREEMHGADFLRSSAPTNSGPIDASPTMLQRDSRVDSATSNRSSRKTRSESVAIPEEKPIASGNGVSVSVHLTEPVLFLQGFDHHDTSTGSTAMLRGNLHLKVAKSAKIKAVTLRFRGTAVTKWPEGYTLAPGSYKIPTDICVQEFLLRK